MQGFQRWLFPEHPVRLHFIYSFISGHMFQIICHMLNTRNNVKHMSELNEGAAVLQHCILHFNIYFILFQTAKDLNLPVKLW